MLRRLLLLSALLAFSGVFASAEAKTLRMAYDADPTSLDPHEQLASATLQLSHLTFDPLLRFRQDLTLEPQACHALGEDRRAHHALSFARRA